ncbi:hypothetical protein [Alysiella crassa]|uniref:Uncharacterized protein n=1 Tax=Alysiella crassa TaxID=153491 RepID=A0A376BT76_9NEIS|nr:hypothetical protein [Alysiella crassa]SSY80038.1 Uncharacterised protein [Alysiella crassa]
MVLWDFRQPETVFMVSGCLSIHDKIKICLRRALYRRAATYFLKK